MNKYCIKKWDKNKELLRNALKLKTKEELEKFCYLDLVRYSVKYILNGDDMEWDYEKITEIDDGDYQGTLIYLIPKNIYQPSCEEYLMTNVYYGSCFGCDLLMSIEFDGCNIEDYMSLCKDIICNTIKPYNEGWRKIEDFEEI